MSGCRGTTFAFLSLLLMSAWTTAAETNDSPPRTDRLGDPLPPGAIARLGTMRLRHDGHIASVAFAPDGKTLASGGDDGTVRIWETATGREQHCLRSPHDNVLALAYSPDGKILASAGYGGGIVLWNPTAGAKWHRLGNWNENNVALAFAPDGKTLAAGTTENIVWWDGATGDRLHSLDGSHNIASVAYSPDGKTLAYACSDEEISLCDPATGKEVRKLRKVGKYPTPYFPSVAFSPDGKKLLVSDEHWWRLLDAATGKELKRDGDPPFHGRPAYAPNGRLIATMSWALKGRPWVVDLSRNKGFELSGGGRVGEAYVAVFSPDSRLLASGGEDGRVRLWDVSAKKELDMPGGDALGQGLFAISRDGRILAALDGDHRVRLWDTANGKLLHTWDTRGDWDFPYLALSSDGSQLAVSGRDESYKPTMQVLDANTGRRSWHSRIAGETCFAAYSPDGKLLAASGARHDIDLWDAATGRPLGRLNGHWDTVVAGVFSPDSKTLVTASEDHTVRVWDVPGRRERHRLKGHGGGATVSHIVFSADGNCIATGGDGGRICIWDAHTGRRLYRWGIDEENVACLALSPDGKTLVANAGKDRFCLWHVATGTASPPIEGHRARVTFAAFQSDGRTLLTASRDGTALVWDLADLRRRPQPQAAPVRTDANGDPLPPGVLARLGSIRLQHGDSISSAAFSPDGRILAAASAGNDERSLRLWEVRTGKELRRLSDGRTPWLDHIAFSPDGKILAGMGGPNNVIHFWDIASGASLGVGVRHMQSLSAFAFSPDGTKIAAAGECVLGGKDFKIYLWDLDTGEQVRVFEGHRSWVQQIAFTSDGKTLVSASPGEKPIAPEVCVWDTATGKRRHRYEGGGTLAANGQTLAFADREKLHVCEAATGRELWSTPIRKAAFVYSPDGKHLLICSRKQPFRLCESATGKEVRRSDKTPAQLDTPLCLSLDGSTLATAWFSTILLWDTKTGLERRPFAGHRSPLMCMSFAPDGRSLVSASIRGDILLWDPAAGKELRVVREPGAIVHAVAFSPDGQRIACGDRRNVVQVWDAATGAEVGRFAAPVLKEEPLFEGVQSLAFAADGRTLAIGGVGAAYLWETATRKPPRRLETPGGVVHALTFFTDGRLTALLARREPLTGSLRANMEIVVWDPATGRGPRRISAWTENVPWSVAVSPDGKLMAINPGTKNGLIALFPSDHIRLYEMATGKEIGRFSSREELGRLTFSPDGARLLAGGTIWDTARDQQVGEVGGHLGAISCIACSPGGRLIATGGDDATILLHSMPNAARRNPAPARDLSEGELKALWNNLSSPDAAVAWRDVHTLIASPEKSVPFLRTVLRPHAPIDHRRLDSMLADLDSERFAVREQARKELDKFGELAEPALRRTLADKPSVEVRRQVLALLEQIEMEASSPGSLRIMRVTAVLERIATTETVELLRRLAAGATEARLTRETAAALERLTRRNVKP